MLRTLVAMVALGLSPAVPAAAAEVRLIESFPLQRYQACSPCASPAAG